MSSCIRDLDVELLSFISYYQTLNQKHGFTGQCLSNQIVAQSVQNEHKKVPFEEDESAGVSKVTPLNSGKISEGSERTDENWELNENQTFYIGESDCTENQSEEEEGKEERQDKGMEERDPKIDVDPPDLDMKDESKKRPLNLKHSSTTDLSKYFTKIPEQREETDDMVWSRWKLALLDDTDDVCVNKPHPRRKKSVLEQRINSEINSAFLESHNSLSMPNISSIEREPEDLPFNVDPSSTDNIADSTNSHWAHFSNKLKSSVTSSMSLFGSLWSLEETYSHQEGEEEEEKEEDVGFRKRIASAPYSSERSLINLNRRGSGHTRSHSVCNNESYVNYDRNVTMVTGSVVGGSVGTRKRFESAPTGKSRKKSWYDLMLQE